MWYSAHGSCTARDPSFGNSGGQKSVIRDFWRPEIQHSGFLAARNPSFRISGGQKYAFLEFWWPEILI